MAEQPGKRPPIALDELERALMQVDQTPRRPVGEDPLAELARLVGQGDPFRPGGGTASLDDLLAPANARPAAPAPVPAAAPPPAAPPAFVQPVEDPASAALAEMVEKAMSEAHLANVSVRTADLPPDVAGLDPLDLAGLRPASVPDGTPQALHEDRMFEQMLAELEATARGAHPAAIEAAVPPPPAPPPLSGIPAPSAGGFDGMMAGVAAGAAAAGVTARGRTVVPEPSSLPDEGPEAAPVAPPARGRRGLVMAVAVVGIALVGVGSLLGFGRRSELPGLPKGEAPVIAAKPGAVKERPANPGGTEVPNQDKAIFQQRQDPAREAERVAPREEQPVDLTQAQRSVRQIPGVPVVLTPAVTAPTTPAAGATASAAPAEPTPAATAPPVRQVQGVPIVLAAPAPVAPPPPPVVAAPPAVVPPSPPAAAEPPPARVEAAQPRRVQSVPVRGEGEPSTPRPAQTARRPAEPAASAGPNAPLSITPPALRGTSTPQRVAAAPPAATASAPARVQSDASPGGGFAVQLAAEGSEEAAQARFTRMQGQFSGALAGQSPSVRRAEVGGRSVYRLRVGNMSREEAVALCERLKSAGGSCFVARN